MDFRRQPLLKLAFGLCLGFSLASFLVGADEQGQNGFEASGGEPFGFLRRPVDSAKSSSRNPMEGSYEQDQHGYQSDQHGHQNDQPQHKDPFYLAGEYTKLMLNPIALIKKISHEFNLPKKQLIEKVGKGLVYGAEALFSPVIACVKIIEKVFVPNPCSLKFVCQFGARLDFMKDTMLKLSPNFAEGSAHIKALSYGIIGRDCAQVFANCEPTLQDTYKDLKEPQQQQDYNQQNY